jgi:zinc transporter 5/7
MAKERVIVQRVDGMPVFAAGNEDVPSWLNWNFLRHNFMEMLKGRESQRIFAFLVINLMFMFVELTYGIWTNSLGLISDACHMLFDCAALGIGLVASVIARWSLTQDFSYGYARVQVLSGFINAIFLVFISVGVLIESLERFVEPPDVSTDNLFTVSFLGFCVNLIGLYAFHDLDGAHGHSHGGGHGHSHGEKHGHSEKEHKQKEKHGHEHGHAHKEKHDHAHKEKHGHAHKEKHGHAHEHKHKEKKEKKKSHESNLWAVYLHVLADTLGSVGVMISALLIQWFGWNLADPICSFFIAVMIFASTIPLLKESALTLLQTTPTEMEHDIDKAMQKIVALDGVDSCREQHFWKFTESKIVATLKIAARREVDEQALRAQVVDVLKHKGISEVCVEIIKPTEYNLLTPASVLHIVPASY